MPVPGMGLYHGSGNDSSRFEVWIFSRRAGANRTLPAVPCVPEVAGDAMASLVPDRCGLVFPVPKTSIGFGGCFSTELIRAWRHVDKISAPWGEPAAFWWNVSIARTKLYFYALIFAELDFDFLVLIFFRKSFHLGSIEYHDLIWGDIESSLTKYDNRGAIF